MLADRLGKAIPRVLLSQGAYHPFPTAEEREAWQAVARPVVAAAVRRGRELLGCEWPALPATLYMDFARTGERSRYEQPCFARRRALATLVIAECLEGKGRFLDDIANGIWAICEESSWVIPAHNAQQGGPPDALPEMLDPCIDLFAGETGALLAWTHYLLKERLDTLSRHLASRIAREVKTRILDPFLAHDDFWWMGAKEGRHLNNWSPWCASTCLSAFLVLEGDRARRQAAVVKAMRIVDRWLDTYHPDGGCDEGPSYWTVAGGALLDCLELLAGATRGRVTVYDEPLVREIGRYIYRVHISGDYFVDFADCPGKVHLPAGLVYRYGRHIADPAMAAFGSWWYRAQGPGALLEGSLTRVLPNLLSADRIGRRGRAPFVRDVWLPGTQIMVARERQGSDQGFYLAAKGGHNAESHNHNDVGQFLAYSDGHPVLVDPGVGVYRRETFSDQRYQIWTMQSAYHNLPTVNGVQQMAGRRFQAREVAYSQDDHQAEFSLDIARAYPPESGLMSWRRTCRLDRTGAAVEIMEEFALTRPTRELTLSLMTPCPPRRTGASALTLPTATHRVRLEFDEELEADVELIRLHDGRLRDAWGDRLYRILLRPRRPVGKGAWRLRIVRA